MNYNQYHKSQDELVSLKISALGFIILVIFNINLHFLLPNYRFVNQILFIPTSLLFTNIFLELLETSLIRFIKKKKVTYLPVSKIVNLPGFNAKHFLENSFTKTLILENNKFKTTPLLEAVEIEGKPYIAFVETTNIINNSERKYNYLLVDENDNYVTEIPKDFKYIKPETKIFTYYTKYTRRGIISIVTNIKNTEE